MQNKPDFKRELRCLAWGLLAAVLAVLACCWTGYDLTDRFSELATYTLINDDYTQYADLTEQGLTQLVPVPAGEPVYGVNTGFGRLAGVRVDAADLERLHGVLAAQ